MSKIKILSENLANQIAAGEVVERPASVVKEFVENAIDAGSKNISIQIEGGVTGLIRIIDDGEGMDQDDILLSLERHATSKIASAEQLDTIDTLGFRGEAVPSIASVAKLSITSRLHDQSLGCRVDVRFGKLMKVHEMGCGYGTIMEVRDLFGNVPARRKFLKTTQTELSHIEEVVRNYALAYHRLGIQYSVKGRDVLRLPANVDDRAQRVGRILGDNLAAKIIRITGPETTKDVTIDGYLVAPDSSYAGNAKIRIFVNGRSVRDRMITHAVAEGMKGFLMKGRRPAGVIYLELDPAAIDVNVHPTKQEIRFHNSKIVHQLISLSVSKALRGFQDEFKESLFKSEEIPLSKPLLNRPVKAVSYQAQQTSLKEMNVAEPEIPYEREKKSEYPSKAPADCAKIVEVSGNVCRKLDSFCPAGGTDKGEMQSSPEAETDKSIGQTECDRIYGQTAANKDFTIIGQLLGTYILCETGEGLVAIDQHAAQERLIFEKLKRQFAARKMTRQTLLFPKMLELSPEELEAINEYGPEIAALGIGIEEFGGSSYVVKAVPAILGHLRPEDMVVEILSQFTSRNNQASSAKATDRLEYILATMACKAAIKAGDSLLPEEMEALITQILKSDVFSHCPHGRPVVKRFSAAEIKKWFRRT